LFFCSIIVNNEFRRRSYCIKYSHFLNPFCSANEFFPTLFLNFKMPLHATDGKYYASCYMIRIIAAVNEVCEEIRTAEYSTIKRLCFSRSPHSKLHLRYHGFNILFYFLFIYGAQVEQVHYYFFSFIEILGNPELYYN
jgi:hypothetical protein